MDKIKFSNFKNNCYHLFQPIFKTSNWQILGYEMLLRHPTFNSTETLFKFVKELEKIIEIDFISIEKAFENIKPNQLGLIFINVHPYSLLDSRWASFMKDLVITLDLNTEQIVFELNVEYSYMGDIEICKLNEAIKSLKRQGFKISLDDVGENPMSIQRMHILECDFIKFNRSISKDLSTSPEKQRTVESLLEIKKKTVIMGGIEASTDLAISKIMGIDMVQGNLLREPTEEKVVDIRSWMKNLR